MWHIGDETADRLTNDDSSVFASWDGDQVVGSRLVASDAAGDGAPAAVSFLADPKTGTETGDPIALWRPVVDPTGRFAVAWDGTVDTEDGSARLTPGHGKLVATRWEPGTDTSGDAREGPGHRCRDRGLRRPLGRVR